MQKSIAKLLLLAGCSLAVAPAAQAADTIKIGKAVQDVWHYTPADVGIAEGLFAKQGLDVEISILSGGAKMQHALLSGCIDLGLDVIQATALSVKHSPTIAVAAI